MTDLEAIRRAQEDMPSAWCPADRKAVNYAALLAQQAAEAREVMRRRNIRRATLAIVAMVGFLLGIVI